MSADNPNRGTNFVPASIQSMPIAKPLSVQLDTTRLDEFKVAIDKINNSVLLIAQHLVALEKFVSNIHVELSNIPTKLRMESLASDVAMIKQIVETLNEKPIESMVNTRMIATERIVAGQNTIIKDFLRKINENRSIKELSEQINVVNGGVKGIAKFLEQFVVADVTDSPSDKQGNDGSPSDKQGNDGSPSNLSNQAIDKKIIDKMEDEILIIEESNDIQPYKDVVIEKVVEHMKSIEPIEPIESVKSIESVEHVEYEEEPPKPKPVKKTTKKKVKS
jgi:hypothetical protein